MRAVGVVAVAVLSSKALAYEKLTPVTISDTSAETGCTGRCCINFEAVVPNVRCWGCNPGGPDLKQFTAFNRSFSFANALAGIGWKNWPATPPSMLSQSGVTIGDIKGDAWATSGPNLQFASYLANASGASGSGTGNCVAIAAATKADLASGMWTYPLQCILRSEAADGPAIAADPMGSSNNLYAAWTDLTTGQPRYRFASMPNCTTGPVGCCADGSCNPPGVLNCPSDPGCKVTYHQSLSSTWIPPSGHGSHPGVAVNPCTGSAVIVYWTGGDNPPSGQIILNIKYATGLNKFNGAIATGLSHEENCVTWSNGQCETDGCSVGDVFRCNMGTNCGQEGYLGCSRLVIKPQVLVDRDGNTCRAYVTYSASVNVAGGRYFRSYLRIYDLGTTSAPKEGYPNPDPVHLKTWVSSPDWYGAWNNYAPTISVETRSGTDADNVGWFWYEDGLGFCNLTYTGAVDGANALSAFSNVGALNVGNFPQLDNRPQINSLTDYTASTVSTDLAGWLNATWAQSIPAPNCSLCNGTSYSTVIKTTRVRP